MVEMDLNRKLDMILENMATKEDVKKLEDKVDKLEGKVDKLEDKVNELEGKMATKDDLIALKLEFNNQLEEFRKEMRESLSKIQGQISDLEGISINMKRDITRLEEKVEILRKDVNSDIKQLEKRQDSLANTVIRLETTFSKKISYLEDQELLNRKEHFQFKEALAELSNKLKN